MLGLDKLLPAVTPCYFGHLCSCLCNWSHQPCVIQGLQGGYMEVVSPSWSTLEAALPQRLAKRKTIRHITSGTLWHWFYFPTGTTSTCSLWSQTVEANNPSLASKVTKWNECLGAFSPTNTSLRQLCQRGLSPLLRESMGLDRGSHRR